MKPVSLTLALALLCLATIFQGCAVMLVGAAAVGTTAGTISYFGNELYVLHEVDLETAWKAAQTTVSELQFQTEPNRCTKDGIKGVLFARNAQKQQVVITVLRRMEKLTEIRIRVGVFDTAANREAAQVIYQKMRTKM
ncbi:MAG: DUF3568 domain-containing protein [Verrucomicrobiae bacterium]|nr:DUF3568 domain-containing protein [Verrucomicrobiae bacterium]